MGSTDQHIDVPAFGGIPRPTKNYHRATYPRIALENTGFDGKGKTVFITGGATGIGLQISHAFARGGVARIVMVSRSPGPLAEAKKTFSIEHPQTEVVTYSASITDQARITEILKEVSEIDILVLCATATHGFVNAEKVTNDEVANVFETNVVAAFDMLKTYLSLPKPRSGAKTVINVSSMAAQVPVPGVIGYGSSKAAITQIVTGLAGEQASKPAEERVRMFSFHPGAFYTSLAEKHVAKDAFNWEDIQLPADFTVWLAGPQSDFLHGRYVWAHWDVDELIALKEKIEKNPIFLTIGLVL